MNILVFGDSISWGAFDSDCGGWVERLKTYLFEHDCFVYNLGISGDTSRGVLYRMKYDIPFRKIDSDGLGIVIAIGINDSSYSANAVQKAPLAHFVSNIEQIYQKAKELTNNILFVGLTPVDDEKTQPVEWDEDLYYANSYSKQYNDVLSQFCHKHNISFLDVNDLPIDGFMDGVHPDEETHEDIFELVKEKIKNWHV